ncbi:MAG TPA: MnhB domain-containing protein [Thermomicrobiales bacterium]|nr:MnhB domain-containing protein [Thermomicrobiales bacterium]
MITLVTRTVAKLLFLPSLMIALATLVKGYADTGDGFTAGVIAGLAVLLQIIVFGPAEVERKLPLRWAPRVAFAGLALALLDALAPLAFGRPVMTHLPPAGVEPIHFGSLELLSAVVFDVGVFLLVFGFSVTAIVLLGRASPVRLP